VIALCQEMIFSGSNVAFRRSVRSIATLGEYQKSDEAIPGRTENLQKFTLLS